MKKLLLATAGFTIGILMLRLFDSSHTEYVQETRGAETRILDNKLKGMVSFIDPENRYMIIKSRDRSITEEYKIKVVIDKNTIITKVVIEKGSNEISLPSSLKEVLPGGIVILRPTVDNDGYIKVNRIIIDSPPKTSLVPHV